MKTRWRYITCALLRGFSVLTMTLVCGQTVFANLSVIDDLGHTVTLPKPAERILSLAPHNTENLFSAGAGDKIVGVAAHSDYPPPARRIVSVGNSYAHINLEAVIALAPDLVVAWQTSGNRETLNKIAELGFVVYYSEPRDFQSIIKNIEDFAILTGRNTPPLIAHLQAELARVRTEFGDKSTQSVFYQLSYEPLITLNGKHIISRVLELCGAHNVFAKLPIIAPRVSVESVLQVNPDIIISGQSHAQQADMSRWKKWSAMSAVQNEGFILVDASAMHRHTARMVTGIRDVCEQIDRVRKRREA